MSKTLLTLGVLAATGALSLCDLCKPDTATFANSLFSAPAVTLATVTSPRRLTPAADTTVTLRVDGMTCGGCVIGVRKVLTRLPGVRKADVTYERQRAVVTYDPAKVTVDRMIAAIAKLGYKATVITG